MKVITLQAPAEAIQTLCRVVDAYVEAAYPAGGSECSQSAREALQSTAQQLHHNYDTENGLVTISRRVKAHLKSALQYYAQTQNTQLVMQQSEQLLRCLDGHHISYHDWPS